MSFAQGFEDGFRGINRNWDNWSDDELSDAYIDGYQAGQRLRYPIEK